MSVNESETFCLDVCRNTFLSLWSYANPQGKDGDELCDILIVCEPDVVIISVKDCTLGDSGDRETDLRRWVSRAVEKSVDQIYGAERYLRGQPCVVKSDGEAGLPLPPGDGMRVHRVAVAFGGHGEIPLGPGDFGKGFVHVLNERSFTILLQELDTIADLTDYLSAREGLHTEGRQTMAVEEADVLAVYLHRGRKFPEANALRFEKGSWDELVRRPEKRAKDERDEISYLWDSLIEGVNRGVLSGNLEFGSSLSENERALRVMARESRFARRILGGSFDDFLQHSTQIQARLCPSPLGTAYVFLAWPHGADRQARAMELQMRCVVAKGKLPDASVIVGIATEQYIPDAGHSLDVALFDPGAWTPGDQAVAEELQRRTGYFEGAIEIVASENEYPVVEDGRGQP